MSTIDEIIKEMFKKHKIFLHDFHCNTEEALKLEEFTKATHEVTTILLNQINTLIREKDIAIKTCDRLAEEKIMLKEEITDLDKKNKDWEEQNSILIKSDIEQVTEIQQLNALIKRHKEVFAQVEIFMEQNNMNDKFDGVWRDDEEKILADVKELSKLS